MKLNEKQRYELIELFITIGYRDLHLLDSCVEKLNKIGIESIKINNPIGIKFCDTNIKSYKTIDNEDGIYALDLLLVAAASDDVHITTRMNGQGFRFYDLLRKLASAWNITIDNNRIP